MASVTRVDRPRAPRPQALADVLERQPPCNLQAEKGVLGSIMILPTVCDDVTLILRAEDFYDDAHRTLYEHILKLHERARKVDITLLVEELERSGNLEAVGGMAYLGEVCNSVPNAANAIYYAEIVREKAVTRSLILASTDILRDAYEEAHASKQLVSQAEQRIFAIAEGRSQSSVQGIADILQQAFDRIDARMKGEHTTGGVDTGFTQLDALMGGLHNSELVILAARPSMGKTAFAMNITEYVSVHLKMPVLFVSLEMSCIELADRMLCSMARVNGHRLRNGTISNEDRMRLVEKAGAIGDSPLYVDDSPSRTVGEIAAAARRIKRQEKKLGLIVIDYLQLIEPDNQSDPRQEQVAKIARRLKGLARELEVPLLCLAQLNRQAEVAKENRPRLSHLRESGAIEQDADVVMFVHREEYFLTGDDREQAAGEAEIIVAKQRNGPIGDVPLFWKKDFTRFENRDFRPHDEFEAYNAAGDAF